MIPLHLHDTRLFEIKRDNKETATHDSVGLFSDLRSQWSVNSRLVHARNCCCIESISFVYQNAVYFITWQQFHEHSLICHESAIALEKRLLNKDESLSLRPHFRPMSEGEQSGWVGSGPQIFFLTGRENGPVNNCVSLADFKDSSVAYCLVMKIL